jgi:hypothetical protein
VRISLAFGAFVVVIVSACGPTYMTAGYQPKWSASGPLAPVIAQNNGGGDSGTANAFSLGLGLGNRRVSIESAIQTFNVGAGTFDVAPGVVAATLIAEGEEDDAAIAGRWATAATALDVRVTAVRWKRLGLYARAGASRAVILDKATLERSWGTGYRYGAGLEVTFLKSAALSIEAGDTRIGFDDGIAAGWTTLRGATLGLVLAR